LFLNRKNYGSALWIMGPRLALGPWWTHDHEAAWPLQGSGDHYDSSERGRERRSSEFSPMAPLGGGDGLMIALNRGDRWCSDGEMVLRARRRDWSRGACGR
jgi:hypothetical protein